MFASHLFFQSNSIPISFMSQGHDIWLHDAHATLFAFKQLYEHSYAALSTNSQFTKRGVKESGDVTLGRRSEKVRSALAMARARLIPDAMAVGHCIIDTSGEKRLVQGKFRTRVLFGEAVSHQQVLNLMKRDTT